jgi:hypothetical protein
MTEAVYDPIGKAREQRRILDLIPPPGEAFHAAARSAMIQAGLSEQQIEFLDQAAREAPPDLSRPTPKVR